MRSQVSRSSWRPPVERGISAKGEGGALPVLVLLDACSLVVGLADVDAAGGVLEGVDARGGAGFLGSWGRRNGAQPASGQLSAVQARLGVA